MGVGENDETEGASCGDCTVDVIGCVCDLEGRLAAFTVLAVSFRFNICGVILLQVVEVF